MPEESVEEMAQKIARANYKQRSLEQLLGSRQFLRTEWKDEDARRGVFSRLLGVVRGGRILHLLADQLYADDFWKAHFTGGPRDHAASIVYVERMLRSTIFLLAFSSVETSMRAFVRALNPSNPSKGNGKFWSVRECVLSQSGETSLKELFELLANVRNAVHNNFVFFSPDGDTTVEWDGKPYEFKVGRPVQFVDLEWIYDRLTDLAHGLVRIVESPALASLSSVPDPSGDPEAFPELRG